jgi:hypothetical protein
VRRDLVRERAQHLQGHPNRVPNVRAELKQSLHAPYPKVGAYLRSVVTGHYRYYGVLMYGPAPSAFLQALERTWH